MSRLHHRHEPSASPGSVFDGAKRDPAGRSLADGLAEDLDWREARKRDWEARLARTAATFTRLAWRMGVIAGVIVGAGLIWAALVVVGAPSTHFRSDDTVELWMRFGPAAYVAAMLIAGLGLFTHWLGGMVCDRLRAAALRDGVDLVKRD